MYAISNASRVYITFLLCLCAAFFLAPSLANANDGYWSTTERRIISQNEVNSRLERIANSNIARPSNSTLSTVPSAPTITKNASGGLSATTNNILKTLDKPSNFSATTNYSSASAKTALKSCVRSPACAGRALGAGAIIYEGINAWKDVYKLLSDDGGLVGQRKQMPVPSLNPAGTCKSLSTELIYETCADGLADTESRVCGSYPPGQVCPLTLQYVGGVYHATGVYGQVMETFQELDVCPPNSYWDPEEACLSVTESYISPTPWQQIDDYIDEGYVPSVSDAPIVLLSGEPETISLTTPEPANLPSTTTTSADSQGKMTTTVKNSVITYNVLNNNSSSPSIESTITETSNTYDDTANLVGSMTSITTNNAVQPDPLPLTPPNAGASVDFELPAFCTWAKPLCDWLGWTQEELGEEDPDLSQLITVFEPDVDGYDVGIGSGSCPAPMQLNLGIINKTVEVKYDPFCDFLEMIRPFVLAAAYLFAAYLYLGVLRRG